MKCLPQGTSLPWGENQQTIASLLTAVTGRPTSPLAEEDTLFHDI
jgi:hypothetical protein